MRTVLTSEKTAVSAPIPKAREKMATTVSAGARDRLRAANRTSCQSRSMVMSSGHWSVVRRRAGAAGRQLGSWQAMVQPLVVAISQSFIELRISADGGMFGGMFGPG